MALRLLNLPSSMSPVLQRYTRVGHVSTGSTIAGVAVSGQPTQYDFSLSGVADGDYDVDMTNPQGQFYLRVVDEVGYASLDWAFLDGTVAIAPLVPAAITGLCNVTFAVVNASGSVVENASVSATIDNLNNVAASHLVGRTVIRGTTNASGYCVLTLIQQGQFTTGGGIYHIIVTDRNRKELTNRYVVIPNTPSVNAKDLVSAY
jgi:uncharacterized GH25 family protein